MTRKGPVAASVEGREQSRESTAALSHSMSVPTKKPDDKFNLQNNEMLASSSNNEDNDAVGCAGREGQERRRESRTFWEAVLSGATDLVLATTER